MNKHKNNLHSLWKKSGLSLDELAHQAGISRSHLAAIKGGTKRLNEDTAASIARVLGCSIGELFSDAVKNAVAPERNSPAISAVITADKIDSELLAQCVSVVTHTSEQLEVDFTADVLLEIAVQLYKDSVQFSEKPSQSAAKAMIYSKRETNNGSGVERR